MKIFNFLFCVLVWISTTYGIVELQEQGAALQLTTLYGTTIITEPVLIALIKSPAFERLKHIHQYGVHRFIQQSHQPFFTRYEHSLGVFFVTRKFGAPLAEQIDALLHDVSHTVFSHVGDSVFNSNYRTGKQSYQDEIHEKYLQQVRVADILRSFGYTVTEVITEGKKQHRCFDQDLPNLCADRIEYNLSGGVLDGYITRAEIDLILADLRYEAEQWFFMTQDIAKKFAHVSLQLSENRWGSAWGAFVDHCAAQAIKRAHVLQIITLDDIHYSTDDVIWNKLCSCNDAHIARFIACIQNCHTRYERCCADAHDIHVTGKFSGTDPFVKKGDVLYRLSELDREYAALFTRVKTTVRNGSYIRYT